MHWWKYKMYWRYLKYIVEHKKNVFLECLKIGQPIHGILHDFSKFLPSEFFPYAEKFFSGDYAYKFFEVENNFDMAWLLHQHRNKHHWEFWVNSEGRAIPMPKKHVMQMIADWRAMSRKFGGDAEEYYSRNKDKMILHRRTKNIIDWEFYEL